MAKPARTSSVDGEVSRSGDETKSTAVAQETAEAPAAGPKTRPAPPARGPGPRDERAWLKTPRAGKVSETIARDILNDIVTRRLQPGTMLESEAVMLERYGVGRGSLREALRILEIHGLVKIKPGPRGGPVVADVTSGDFGRSATLFFHALGATFADLLAARLVIEPIMARLAAERLTPEGAEVLTEALEAHERDETQPSGSWNRTSADFHGAVTGMSGNPVLDLIGRSLLDIYTERIGQQFPASARADVRHAHERIAQAILDREPAGAEERMRRHVQSQIDQVRQNLPGMLEELIDWR